MGHKPIAMIILPLALAGILMLAVLTAIPSSNRAFAQQSNNTGNSQQSNNTPNSAASQSNNTRNTQESNSNTTAGAPAAPSNTTAGAAPSNTTAGAPAGVPQAGKHAICMFGRCSETIFASSHRLSVPEPCRGMHLKPVLTMHGTWICKRYGRS
jgi:hypothetical protein